VPAAERVEEPQREDAVLVAKVRAEAEQERRIGAGRQRGRAPLGAVARVVDAEVGDADAALVDERADIVDRATDILEQMLDDVMAQSPTDAKGQDLVPQWSSDYRTYIADRRLFTESLRESGQNLPFYETEVGGIPISEKLEVFAADNHMATCSPPRDLTR
jgi:hypothetical protein